MTDPLISIEDVRAARAAIADRVHVTPTIPAVSLGERFGVSLHLKLESLQRTGSFKARGVLNALRGLDADARRRGVVTLSAGNHGQALAWAASELGIPSVIVMPVGAVPSKVQATRGYGGEVVLTDESLLDTCLSIRDERDLVMIHPFDDPAIIAGQGTVGLEVLEAVPDFAAIVVGVGGGGLVSGVATAVKAERPEVRVIGVEPNGADAMRRSLERGEPVHLDRLDTIADGLAAPFAGRHTLAHVAARVDEIVTVDDGAIREAVEALMMRGRVVAEPAGAAPLAAIATGRIDLAEGDRIVCVVSGGNVAKEFLATLV